MKPQIFAAPTVIAASLALVGACGTNPADDEPGEADTESDTADGEEDNREDVVANALDVGSDAGPDIDADATDISETDVIGANVSEPGVEEDTEPDLTEDVQPDALERVTPRGWSSNAFEHAGFIPEDDIDIASFDAGCSAYMVPLD